MSTNERIQIEKINGYIVAPFTPMLENGDLNLNLISEYAEFIKRNAIDGVFICGTTGEGALLTREERMSVAEEWIKECKKDLKVIVHTGGTNVREQQTLAEHAQNIGAWGFAAMAPAFLAPKRNQEFIVYCKTIASFAPELPFYYYHFPSINNFNLSTVDFLNVAENEIPNLAGVKFTHSNMDEFNKCRYIANGKYEILLGLDEMFLDGLALGNKAGVGGTYNHCFSLYKEMKIAYDENNMVKCHSLQHKSHEFINILGKYRGNIMGGKRIMKFLGLDCGPNRVPLQTISESEEIELKKDLEKIDFFEYCNK